MVSGKSITDQPYPIPLNLIINTLFQASVKNDTEFGDYYVWRDADTSSGGRKLPNNWKSVFGGSAWTWNEKRSQYYLHQFLDKQPDLNLRNPNVKKALKEVLQFWLKRKIDGIRIDAVSHLFEDESFTDEEGTQSLSFSKGIGNDYESLKHDKTRSQPENYEILGEWRKVVKQSGLKKILISEAYDPTDKLLQYYGTSKDPLIDLPFNMNLTDVSYSTTANKLKETIESWISATEGQSWPAEAKPPGPWSAWVTGNHDKSRLVTRLGHRLADAMLMVMFLLPRNTPVVYYGDEIGMSDHNVIPNKADNEGDSTRFQYRSPMQWNKNNTSAGFTDANTNSWLFVPSSYTQYNVEVENDANTTSHLKVFKSLIELRKTQAETILVFN